MAKFRYIIVSTFNGDIKGTDDEATAMVTARSEDDFVYDTQEGLWIDSDHEKRELMEARKIEDVDEGAESEDIDLDDEDKEEEEDDEE